MFPVIRRRQPACVGGCSCAHAFVEDRSVLRINCNYGETGRCYAQQGCWAFGIGNCPGRELWVEAARVGLGT